MKVLFFRLTAKAKKPVHDLQTWHTRQLHSVSWRCMWFFSSLSARNFQMQIDLDCKQASQTLYLQSTLIDICLQKILIYYNNSSSFPRSNLDQILKYLIWQNTVCMHLAFSEHLPFLLLSHQVLVRPLVQMLLYFPVVILKSDHLKNQSKG